MLCSRLQLVIQDIFYRNQPTNTKELHMQYASGTDEDENISDDEENRIELSYDISDIVARVRQIVKLFKYSLKK